MLEKYAVHLGGGQSHRFGLDDGVVIRANHIAIAGGIATAVKRAKDRLGRQHKIEVQVSRETDLREALADGADMLFIENLPPEEVARLVAVARELSSAVTIECSGDVTLENVRDYAEAGVDMIGVDALTNSARAMNVSFQLQPF
jgi:nicotinate-nucleotide pyrophosphorylase (carboxylating)